MRSRITFFCWMLWYTVASCEIVENRKDRYQNVKTSFEEYIRTGKRPANFEEAVRNYNSPNYFHSSTGTFEKTEVCTLCELLVDLIMKLRRDIQSDELFSQGLNYLCLLLQMENERVCKGFVELRNETFRYLIDNNPKLNSADVCGIISQHNDCPLSDSYDWEVNIPPGNTIRKLKLSGSKTFNILHITDIHYDPLYTTNKTNDCGEPVCCQFDQPDGTNETNSCGYWADYKMSDIPWRTVVNGLEQTKKHKYDYVYFTGDIMSHRTWETSVSENSRVIAQIFDAFSEYYKVPVFPILGNHEPHPANLFSTGVNNAPYSDQWLFDIMFQKMSKWVPIDEVKETILKGGYYTVSPRKGFRVIVLNNCVGYIANWWIIDDPVDQYGQLQWLTEVLLAAEKNDERVHILYHLPTGDPHFYRIWGREYRKIVDRFANTITGQFNGHEHRDDFYVFYNRSDPNQAINMAWNGASLVTYYEANPSYKIYTIDDKNFDVVDIDEWTFNVTLANQYPDKEPEWYKIYSFKDAWGVESLDAVEIDRLVQNMTKKHELIDQYYNFRFKNSDAAIKNGLDDNLRKALLCIMVTTDGDKQMCEKVSKMFDDTKSNQVSVN
ncbi:sphingomyelin phosphodiesterase 1-like [Leptinotarsa decemlineata]|uniref:sphingomyelin phosphodiesterase 1-like n=1 Tax=Leptinotarsa decemlineata TaxID=7539 RepID=UPI003D307229